MKIFNGLINKINSSNDSLAGTLVGATLITGIVGIIVAGILFPTEHKKPEHISFHIETQSGIAIDFKGRVATNFFMLT